MKLSVRNEEFFLHPARVLLWPTQNLMIVADIHLGKAQTFLKNGLWMPPQAHMNDLEILSQVIKSQSIQRVLFLGDFIHSPEGLTPKTISEFVKWKNSLAVKLTVVIGNHDRPALKSWPKEWDFIELVDFVKINNFILQHEPPETKLAEFVWCGHLHPKVKMRFAGDELSLPAFVVTPDIGYLPAFSSLAGGAPFAIKKNNRYFVTGENSVSEIKV